MTARAALYEVQHDVLPHQVQGLGAVPAAIRRRYLVDGDKYLIGAPAIRQAAREAVGAEKNPYWIARRIYRYVHKRVEYKLAGGWNVAPKVLARGSGSCSEYRKRSSAGPIGVSAQGRRARASRDNTTSACAGGLLCYAFPIAAQRPGGPTRAGGPTLGGAP